MDSLIGMKENVIIGKPIPAGTGMKLYRNLKLDSDGRLDELLMDDFFEDEDFADEETEDISNAAFVDSFDDDETDEAGFDDEVGFDDEAGYDDEALSEEPQGDVFDGEFDDSFDDGDEIGTENALTEE